MENEYPIITHNPTSHFLSLEFIFHSMGDYFSAIYGYSLFFSTVLATFKNTFIRNASRQKLRCSPKLQQEQCLANQNLTFMHKYLHTNTNSWVHLGWIRLNRVWIRLNLDWGTLGLDPIEAGMDPIEPGLGVINNQTKVWIQTQTHFRGPYLNYYVRPFGEPVKQGSINSPHSLKVFS